MNDALPVPAPRYGEVELLGFADAFRRDGFVLLPGHFDPGTLVRWRTAFEPLLARHIAGESAADNRGTQRYYVTLPFRAPFADPRIFNDPDVVQICRLLVGDDLVMCQLASDTPLRGSAFQDVHRDAPPLFPELSGETPPYQLAVNFSLVDVTPENGPTQIAPGTHNLAKDEGLKALERGDITLVPIEMRIGDVLIRDVRGLHRGTPNTTATPRPMIVIGYSRRWLFRPEVTIRIGRSTWERLSDRERYLLRFNPIVSDDDAAVEAETYRAFAY